MRALSFPVLASDPISHVTPHDVGLGHVLTNQVVMLCVAALLLLAVMPAVARRRDRVPRGLYNFVESILQFVREQVARPALHEATDRFVPVLWTVFWLILVSNLIGMLPVDPIVTAITGRPSHLAGTPTGNLSVTAGLAICAFLLIHVGGMREQGVGPYLKNFAPHVAWPLLVLLVPLEILGALVKPFALAIRLFANMIAGHIVIAVLLGFTKVLAEGFSPLGAGITLASVAGALFISLLEVFVAFLQAYIFTFLTTLFLGMAVHPEH